MSSCEQPRYWQSLLSRRRVLQGMALVGGAMALGAAFPSNEIDFKEGLIPISNVATFDFVSPYSRPGNVKYSYLETLDNIKQLLGPSYNVPLNQVIGEFGPYAFSEDVFRKEIGTEYAEYGAVAGGMLAFASHGKRVSDCQQAFCKQFGYDFIPHVFPVQEGLTIQNFHNVDLLGNPSVLLHMSSEPVRNRLALLPYLDIVNISLQFGTLAITHKRKKIQTRVDDTIYKQLEHSLLTFYKKPETTEYLFYDPNNFFLDGESEPILRSVSTGEAITVDNGDYTVVSEADYEQYTYDKKKEILEMTLKVEEIDTSKSPYYEIRGAYTGEYGVDNIRNLFSLVNSFPEKLFIVAAGNYGDDIEPLRAQLTDEWPENLIIAGHWDSTIQYPRMYNTYDIFGADIYFDASQIGDEYGSSFATAVLSGAASILYSRGFKVNKIKEILFNCCDEIEIERKANIPRESINREEYIYAELNKKKERVRVFNQMTFDSLLKEI